MAFNDEYFWRGHTKEQYMYGQWGEKELKDEYQRLYKIASERLRKLGKSDFKYTDAYRSWEGRIEAYSKLDPTERREGLKNLYRFLSQKSSQVSWQKKDEAAALKFFQEKGYKNFVNEKNIKEFRQFMGIWDARGRKYSSPIAAKAFEQCVKEGTITSGMTPEEVEKAFDDMMKRFDEGEFDGK